MKKEPINPNVLELCKFIASHDNIVDYGSMFDEIKNACKSMVLHKGKESMKSWKSNANLCNNFLQVKKTITQNQVVSMFDCQAP